MVLSGTNTYTGVTTISGGIVRVTNNAGLGAVNPTDGTGTNVIGADSLLELAGVTIGDALRLEHNNTMDGIDDQPATVNQAGTRMASGGLRAVDTDSIPLNRCCQLVTGPVQLRDASARTFGITVNAGASLDLSNVLSGTDLAAANVAHNLVKQGAGELILSGGAANTLAGTTYVQEGTVTLNKSTGVAIAGPLVIGDTCPPELDLVQYGASATNDQIANSAAVTVLRSGRLVMSSTLTGTETIASLVLGTGDRRLGRCAHGHPNAGRHRQISTIGQGGGTSPALPFPATIAGRLDFGTGTKTITTNVSGSANSDLV